jgi:N-acetylmuramoyl-L-alanine amidase
MQNAHLNASLSFAEDVANAMGGSPIRHSRGVSQDPFWVLWRTAMPAVLIEVGFMTNPEDLSVLRSAEGRDEIASNIFRAFCVFKHRYDGSSLPQAAPQPEPEPEPQPEPQAQPQPEPQAQPQAVPQPEPQAVDDIIYGIQVLASSKQLSPDDAFFKGYKPLVIKVDKLYKYIVCTDSSLAKVKSMYKKVSSTFKDSYVVKVQDGVSSPAR